MKRKRLARIFEKLRYWPGEPPKRPPPINVPMKSGSRGTDQSNPGPQTTSPEADRTPTISQAIPSRYYQWAEDLCDRVSGLSLELGSVNLELHRLAAELRLRARPCVAGAATMTGCDRLREPRPFEAPIRTPRWTIPSDED